MKKGTSTPPPIIDQTPLHFLKNDEILFCIIEKFENDEAADQTEKIIYFYPEIPQVNQMMKVNFGGGILSISGIVHDFFTDVSIDYISLEKHILSFKVVDTYTLVLCTSNEVPPSTVTNHLNHIYKAMSFYFKGFELFNDRDKKKIDMEFNELMEIITTNIYKNKMSAFNPLPYTPLPNRSQRIFIQTTQLIDNILSSDHLGGAVFFRNTVLFSNFELPTTTKFILDKIEYTRRKHTSPILLQQQQQQQQQQLSPQATTPQPLSPQFSAALPAQIIPEDYHQTVYISPSEYQNLKNRYNNQDNKKYEKEDDNNGENSSDGNNNNNNVHQFINLELLIMFYQDLTIAILTEIGNKQLPLIHLEFNKIRLNHNNKILGLEKELENSFDNRPSPPQVIYRTTISPSNNFHFLSYDSLTNMAVSSGIYTVNEENFINTCTAIHDSFIENPDVTQMFIRNHNGEIFCKKQFGREIYYQPKLLYGNNKFLENSELTIQSHLKDHNINTL
ncbi:hypothetical protein CYY_006477 [Polysphondylium violaceum]|uniref:CCZ1/INTU/HSP4 first Longin domain-containing protein n=1 Tax=Polysphondylium violaceum TaxID=133409 RepID=A0A8J4URH1_9MYCE|nr:hypothetical protein CYY_006477 [Polysphondylium violaceum]